MTHTVATLEISKEAYEEISDRLAAAGRIGFIENGMIDMSGIGLISEEDVESQPKSATEAFAMAGDLSNMIESFNKSDVFWTTKVDKALRFTQEEKTQLIAELAAWHPNWASKVRCIACL